MFVLRTRYQIAIGGWKTRICYATIGIRVRAVAERRLSNAEN